MSFMQTLILWAIIIGAVIFNYDVIRDAIEDIKKKRRK